LKLNCSDDFVLRRRRVPRSWLAKGGAACSRGVSGGHGRGLIDVLRQVLAGPPVFGDLTKPLSVPTRISTSTLAIRRDGGDVVVREPEMFSGSRRWARFLAH